MVPQESRSGNTESSSWLLWLHRAFKIAPRPGAQLLLPYRQLGTAISLSQRRPEWGLVLVSSFSSLKHWPQSFQAGVIPHREPACPGILCSQTSLVNTGIRWLLNFNHDHHILSLFRFCDSRHQISWLVTTLPPLNTLATKPWFWSDCWQTDSEGRFQIISCNLGTCRRLFFFFFKEEATSWRYWETCEHRRYVHPRLTSTSATSPISTGGFWLRPCLQLPFLRRGRV